MPQVVKTMQPELMAQMELLLRIVVAGVCGAFIGLERQNRLKNAGLKTHLLVALTSALMVVISKYGFFDVISQGLSVDASRVAASVASGVGFLGAGLILAGKHEIMGVTTAAGIWATVGIWDGIWRRYVLFRDECNVGDFVFTVPSAPKVHHLQ